MADEAKSPAAAGDAQTGAKRRARTPSEARRIEELLEIAGGVVGKLKVHPFLERNAANIRNKLSYYVKLTEERRRGDLTFATLSMPIASGVIHVASEPEDVEEAEDYLEEAGLIGPDDESFQLLTVLVLIYIVHRGRMGEWQEVVRDPQTGEETGNRENHQETWEDFWRRIENAVREIKVIPPARTPLAGSK